ncbi:MAG: alanine--tRNA ligase, partial [Planctomycetota bacterium]
MKPDELRDKFLDFFRSKDHTVVEPDLLVPRGDPTLLFTGAGMNQFKNEFVGGGRKLKRAATCQPCLRTGDIDRVGKTPYHHTFFEMLGNFSFGDYYKEDAIVWAWEFCTDRLKIPEEKLCVSVYLDDEEAYDVWRKSVKLPEDRIYRFDAKHNFWPAEAPEKGPDGLCGPCSEIFYDWGEGVFPCDNPDCDPCCSCGRYAEIWNLVFQVYERRGPNNLIPLKQKNIDTGAGFERILAVVNGVHSNYDTELIKPIIEEIERFPHINCEYSYDSDTGWRFRRIADHVRALCFAIAENIIPDSAADRGSVLRKLLRRAYLDGRTLGIEDESFLYKLVPIIAEIFAKPYPQLKQRADNITHILKEDEEKFAAILDRGWAIVEDEIRQIRKAGADVYPGERAFRLHDTHGFPVDITEEIVAEHDMKFDREGFERCLGATRMLSRQTSKFTGIVFKEGPLQTIKGKHPKTKCIAWDEYVSREKPELLKVLAIISPENKLADEWSGEGEIDIILDRTPFYAESGGQVGDTGVLGSGDGSALARVTGTYVEDGYRIHHGVVEKGVIRVGDNLIPCIDASRADIQRNHTATHLLHHALREVLGPKAEQSGSLVEAARLRFDFTHKTAMTPEEVARVEEIVNEKILADTEISTRQTTLDEAKKEGVIALFGEKYGEKVRVVDVGGFSRELCGGTHCGRTGEIGLFKIIRESSIASGIRRIEAVTGRAALKHLSDYRNVAESLCKTLKTTLDKLPERVAALQNEIREMKK